MDLIVNSTILSTTEHTLVHLAAPDQQMATALSAQRRILGRYATAIEKNSFSTTTQKMKRELVIPVELVSDTL